MDLTEIRKIARDSAGELTINWDQIDNDPSYTFDFERLMQRSQEMLPELEMIHKKLSEGKSVAFEGEDSPLKYEDKEQYQHLIEAELFAGYQLQDLWERYNLIKSITEIENDV